MKTLREAREQKYDNLRFDLLLLVGTQPEHDIDPARLDDAVLVQAGKALSQRLQVLRESELAYRQARATAEQMSAAAAAAATEAREGNRVDKRALLRLNQQHTPPPGALWLARWQLLRQSSGEQSSIYAEQADAVSYARKHWAECRTVRSERPAAPEELFEEVTP